MQESDSPTRFANGYISVSFAGEKKTIDQRSERDVPYPKSEYGPL